MAFSFSCGDVMPGCAASFESVDEAELLRSVGAPAANDHGLVELSPAVLEQVRAQIRSSDRP